MASVAGMIARGEDALCKCVDYHQQEPLAAQPMQAPMLGPSAGLYMSVSKLASDVGYILP
jgi:hypothetical protein